jgi:hypothetical protein
MRSKPTTVLVVENISVQKIISTETLSEGSPIYDYAYPLQIRWKDSDFSPSSSSASNVPTPTTLPAAPSGSPAGNIGDKGRLPTGAIVAIAVVLGVAVTAAIVAFIFWKLARQRRQRRSQHSELPAVVITELDARNKEVHELEVH